MAKVRGVGETSAFSPISDEDVRDQVLRLISAKSCQQAPRLRQFLEYVTDETLNGRAQKLKGFTIAQEVFGRDDVEDAQTSTIVAVEARRLRRLLDQYYIGEGKDDPIRISIPKGSYVPAFEPNSVAGTNNTSHSAAKSKLTGAHRWLRGLIPPLALLTIAAVAVSLIWFPQLLAFKLTDRSHQPVSKPAAGKSLVPAIAVLPFEVVSLEPGGLHFVKGLTEDIVTELSKLPGIDVIALASIQALKDKDLKIQKIGKDLRLSHILQGTVRLTQQRLRMTTQLINSQTGTQIWALRFDRKLQDELALQIELATKVADSLLLDLDERERERLRKSRLNPAKAETLVLYKQALVLRRPSTEPARHRIALEAFKRVIELDPAFAGGYAGAALTHAANAWWGHSQSPDEDIRNAIKFAHKAIEIDPNFPLTYSALAFSYIVQKNFDKALTASSKSASLQPSSPSMNARHGFVLCANGHNKRGIQYAKRALRLDPYNSRTPYLNILVVCYFHAGQYQDALKAERRNAARGGPFNTGVQAHIVSSYAMLGRYNEARKRFKMMKKFNRGFAWKAWIRRTFKHERSVELVLGPIRDLGIR